MRWNRAARVSLDLQKPISEPRVPTSVSCLYFIFLRQHLSLSVVKRGPLEEKQSTRKKSISPSPTCSVPLHLIRYSAPFRLTSLPSFLKAYSLSVSENYSSHSSRLVSNLIERKRDVEGGSERGRRGGEKGLKDILACQQSAPMMSMSDWYRQVIKQSTRELWPHRRATVRPTHALTT